MAVLDGRGGEGVPADELVISKVTSVATRTTRNKQGFQL